MADVRPLNALHYDLDAVGSLQDVVAPPYDVIDAGGAPSCCGARPTTRSRSTCPSHTARPGPRNRGRPLRDARRRRSRPGSRPAPWSTTPSRRSGRWSRNTPAPTAAPTRHGILARVRVEDFDTGKILPHERTLPGPKQDRLELMRATRCNLSPIFSLSTRTPGRWSSRRPSRRALGRGDRRGGTVTGSGGSATPVHRRVTELLADAQLLIADGHHRYETAIAYRDEVGGEGEAPQLHADGADRPRRPRAHRLPHPPPALRLRRRPRAPAPPRRGPARALRGRGGRARRRSTRSARRASASSASTTPIKAGLPPAAQGRAIAELDGCSRASPRPTAASTRRSSRPWC